MIKEEEVSMERVLDKYQAIPAIILIVIVNVLTIRHIIVFQALIMEVILIVLIHIAQIPMNHILIMDIKDFWVNLVEEVMEREVMEREVMEDGVMEDGVMENGVMEEEVMEEEVMDILIVMIINISPNH